ncbi:hypothetical protein DPMN_009637, partial [Dreissena polymorpha]
GQMETLTYFRDKLNRSLARRLVRIRVNTRGLMNRSLFRLSRQVTKVGGTGHFSCFHEALFSVLDNIRGCLDRSGDYSASVFIPDNVWSGDISAPAFKPESAWTGNYSASVLIPEIVKSGDISASAFIPESTWTGKYLASVLIPEIAWSGDYSAFVLIPEMSWTGRHSESL